MKTIPFDISQVKFDERFIYDDEEIEILFFIAPKEWLDGKYPEAIHSEISIEYPIATPDAMLAYVTMSPTRIDEEGNTEDYDWYDIDLNIEDIKSLICLSKKNKSTPEFELGKLVVTSAVAKHMQTDEDFARFVQRSLYKYINCDWGSMDDEGKHMNNDAVKSGNYCIHAAYVNKTGDKIWIITEWDRSATTVLFPSEY